jgi:hypothetical protein
MNFVGMTPEFGQSSLGSCRQEPSSARRSYLCPTVWRTWRPRMSYIFNCVIITSGLAGRPSLRTGDIRRIQNRIGEQLASVAPQKASDGLQLAFSEKGALHLTSRAAPWGLRKRTARSEHIGPSSVVCQWTGGTCDDTV